MFQISKFLEFFIQTCFQYSHFQQKKGIKKCFQYAHIQRMGGNNFSNLQLKKNNFSSINVLNMYISKKGANNVFDI